MALLRLQNEADCLNLQLTKQSPKHQHSSDPNRSYPYRASGLVLGLIPVYRDDRADTGQQTAKKRSECDKPLAGAVGN
jgi:hypothetical protein